MKPPLLIDIGFPRNYPVHWPRSHRGRRKPITGSNDQQRTHKQETPAQSPIPDQIQPRSQTRGLDRFRNGNTNPQTPERPIYMANVQRNAQYGSIMGRSGNNNPEDLSQENGLDGSHQKLKGWNTNKNSKL
ncbi:hypothetical protein O181_000191 [Austropuccinia psidii MF-1]|uniref:Uncharacterized protein n=1 Tax=Austropuccinia psidii MF-1 TaxID=1389203 RepID=A0A9Q3B8G6_9BASI|nr:hypothetical protein [Austropuccinia psidii MF-1]